MITAAIAELRTLADEHTKHIDVLDERAADHRIAIDQLHRERADHVTRRKAILDAHDELQAQA